LVDSDQEVIILSHLCIWAVIYKFEIKSKQKVAVYNMSKSTVLSQQIFYIRLLTCLDNG